MSEPPLHVVQPVADHGVSILAAQVARTVGAAVADLETALRAPSTRVHVHVTEALFGRDADEAARHLVTLGSRHRMTVTLHDVPQPGNGTAFARRARAYRQVSDASAAWAVSSTHEARLLAEHVGPRHPGVVLPLPVVAPATAGAPGPTDGAVVGLLGWVYPGKGHAQVVAACAGLGRPVTVRALGAVVAGYDPLVEELTDMARAGGVRFEVTGWLEEPELAAQAATVAVPICAHRSVSASGSLNSWLAVRRRPIVVDGAYAEEVDRLRPGTVRRVRLAGLRTAIAAALDDPGSTWLGPDAVLRPDLEDVGRAYLRWWASLS